MHPRNFIALLVTALLFASVAAHTFAHAPSHQPTAADVVTTYFKDMNAGMKSGDFSALATVFAPDATFTRSTPTGKTTVYHGIAAITAFFQTLPTSAPGYQWTTDSMRVLAPTVVLAYEHAGSPPLKVAGRCVHVFRVEGGKIATYDWAVFYPGVK
jgi:ketosteroid isomerase-like protein